MHKEITLFPENILHQPDNVQSSSYLTIKYYMMQEYCGLYYLLKLKYYTNKVFNQNGKDPQFSPTGTRTRY